MSSFQPKIGDMKNSGECEPFSEKQIQSIENESDWDQRWEIYKKWI